MNPNLFLVGAMKAGTTSLYHYLSQHQDIFFSKVKEPHYYALADRAALVGGVGDAKRYEDTFILTKDEYKALYAGAEGFKYYGDASAMYLYFRECANKIKQDSANAKIIIAIRNPIDRAYSSYRHLVRDGRESLSFEEALAKEEFRIQSGYLPIWYYRDAGMYFEQICEFIKVFGKRNVKVVLYEDLSKDASSVVAEILQFLGLDYDDSIKTSNKFNVSGKPKNRTFQSLLNSDLKLKRAISGMIPSRVRFKLKNNLLSMNYEKFPPLETNLKRHLKSHFESDVQKLSDLIEVDLKQWGFDEE